MIPAVAMLDQSDDCLQYVLSSLFPQSKKVCTKMDRSVLEEAELTAQYDLWTSLHSGALIIGAFFGVLVALAALASVYSQNKKEATLKQAIDFVTARDAKILESDESEWPVRLLIANDWSIIAEDDDVITLKKDGVRRAANGSRISDFMIKKGDQTLVWSSVVILGEGLVWPYSENADELIDGTIRVSVREAVSGTGIGDLARKSGEHHLEIIGIGLESSHGGDPDDLYRSLSDSRGIKLISAANKNIEMLDDREPPKFRTLGLGRALSETERDTNLERHQRSAILMLIERRRHDVVAMPLKAALEKLIFEIKIDGVDLFDYEYSCVADRRLSVPIAFGGTTGKVWQAPKLSVEEALAARPCDPDNKAG